MMWLVADRGRWATLDNSMIFSNKVLVMDEKDAMRYHLIDDERNELVPCGPKKEYIVREGEDAEA